MELKNIKLKHSANYIVVAILGIVFTVMTLVGSMRQSIAYLLESMSISVVLAVSLSIVVGFLGELSLGHAGFMCAGAYIGGKISILLTDALGDDQSILALFLSLVVGGLFAALCGLIVGLPALRLKGDYLAIVTLAFGEIVRVLFQNSPEPLFGGTLGMEGPRFNYKYFFIICFILILFTLAITQNFIRSKHGRAITAIRDNEIAARATGINVTKYKLLGFTLSAFFAGIAGVMYSYSNTRVDSQVFDYNYSIEILVMVVLGGMGNINGSIVAAVLITFLRTKLPAFLNSNNLPAELQDLIFALVLILVVVYNNAPGLKNFREQYNFKKLLAKIKNPKSDPSKIRDDEAVWNRVETKIKMDEVLSVDVKTNNEVYTPDKPGKENK